MSSIRASNSSNHLIAKNTLLLYVRMIIVMLVGLYTSRVVLNTLGVVDYGIYAVVGGPVAIFGFLNISMASSTQRYLNFELGRGNRKRLQNVFMTATLIHLIISIVIVVLAETVGLWLLKNKMTIPVERMDAALWVYQLSICVAVLGIVCTPFNSAIIAHEKMSAFAYISIIDVVMKLAIVFLIQVSPFDLLVSYASLLLVTQIFIQIIYGIYCKRNFDETKCRFIIDKYLFKDMSMFAIWSLWGNMAHVGYTQGVNILLNVFFGPKVNAARSIALTVFGQSTQFASGFQTAVNPQITKLFAQQKIKEMNNLLIHSCKFSFFLILIFAVPVFIEAPFILKMWLKIVPEYTVVFLRISLFIALIDTMARPLMTAAQAIGIIMVYNTVVGGLLLSICFIAYVVLKLGGDPVSVYVVQLIIIIVAFFVRLLILRPKIGLSLRTYLKQVVLKSGLISLVSVMAPVIMKIVLGSGIWQSCFVILVSFISVLSTVYIIGMNSNEKILIRQLLFSKVQRLCR